MFFRVLMLICFAGTCLCVSGQMQDSLSGYDLREVVISERASGKENRSTTPLQIFDSEDIQRLHALQLSDAVKYFSGVTVKDYGGVGGLKTISVRSLGANHTAVGYDGITLSDCQSGQIDLSRFSLDNVENISLNAGQNDDIFQTARMFASASVLNVQTVRPSFSPGKTYHFKGEIKAGSFGLFNPKVLFDKQLSRKFSSSINIEWLQSEGDYPYTLYYGNQNDSTSREKRKNTDVKNLRAETGLFGKFNNNGQWRLKTYYSLSERGLPGSTVFYSPYENQRLEEKNFFAQSGYEQDLSSTLVWQVNGKFNWSYQQYSDPDYLGKEARTDHFYQWEYYLSSVFRYRVIPNLSFSLATDATINTMNADMPSFAYPLRFTGLSVLAGKYTTERVSVVADLLATFVNEQTNYRTDDIQSRNYGKSGNDEQKLSPAISISIQPLRQEDLRLRLMYKEIFRMPTFNDLYYSRIGNPDLKPEYTWQYNAGITWKKKISKWLPEVSMSIDCYYNKIKDKIVAEPGKNLFEWSMQNLGKVDIYGTDLNLGMQFCPAKNYLVDISGTYTFQKAWDVTSKTDFPESLHYKHQIAYTPEQSGSGRMGFQNPWVDLAYTILWSGERYTMSQNTPENYLSGYTDQSISMTKRMQWKGVQWTVSVEVLNLFDEQYDVIRWYPMPGRAWRMGCKVGF